MDTWCDVADAGSLTSGNCRTVEARGLRIALVCLEDGFHAVEDAFGDQYQARGQITVSVFAALTLRP